MSAVTGTRRALEPVLSAPASGVGRPARFAALRARWLRALIAGLVIYALVTVAAVETQNIHLVPSVLVLGALLLPVTFVIFAWERLSVPADALPALSVCFAAGGSIGVAAASLLEWETVRELGLLPMLAVGIIEESVKLIVPVYLLFRGRFRTRGEAVLFGVAAGMGFAALETMGYGLVALIQSHGRIGDAEAVLLFRGLLSPVGHAAWTGLVCAALWRGRAIGRAGPRRLLASSAFATAVLLHALWDSTDGIPARAALAAVSGALLARELRRVVPRTRRVGPACRT